jgi:hypothetical protein
MDMATERIVTQISHNRRLTLHFKFEQYDRYFTSGRFARTYGPWDAFHLAFVTYDSEMVKSIRSSVADLPSRLHQHYRLSTFEHATGDLLGLIWKSHVTLATQGSTLWLGKRKPSI